MMLVVLLAYFGCGSLYTQKGIGWHWRLNLGGNVGIFHVFPDMLALPK
jgi:hypothetical protein